MFKKKDLTNYLFLVAGIAGVTIYMGDWQVAVAAWIAPVFLLKFLRNARFGGFFIAFVGFGIASSIAQNGILPTDDIGPRIFTIIRFAITFSIPFIIDRIFYRKQAGFWLTLIYPVVLVIEEYLFSVSTFGTWGILPYSQLDFNVLLQLSSLTGMFGITFIVAWFASVINWLWEYNFSMASLKRGGLVYAAILVAVLLYGGIKISFFPANQKTVKVAAISGETNIFPIIIDAENASEYVSSNQEIEKQIQLTRDAAREGAKIIAWHEGALVLNSKNIYELTHKIKQIADAYDAYILMAYLELNVRENEKPFNNKNVLFDIDGETVWEYKKSHLGAVIEESATNAGKGELPHFDTKFGRLSTAICYDMEFPKLIHQAGKKQVDILLVPGCDWKGITPIHTHMSKLEAIQNSFNLVRIASPGLSAAFDYHGKVIARKNSFLSGTGILYAEVPVYAPNTIYATTGNIFAWLSIAAFTAFLVWFFIQKRKN